ncbi:MAG: excisionase family DNA-binding protein [Actinomycetia bacterium]|nr:excisionase family DNA-binding protein [Actinomycetes bacterium]
MSTSTSSRRWAPTNAAAKYAGVHPNTIRNWVAAGKIKAYRTPGGRLYLFDLDELDAAVVSISA